MDPAIPKQDRPQTLKGGVVVLRAEVDESGRVTTLKEDVRNILGVIDVNNLLHLSGEVAHNTIDRVEANRRQ